MFCFSLSPSLCNLSLCNLSTFNHNFQFFTHIISIQQCYSRHFNFDLVSSGRESFEPNRIVRKEDRNGTRSLALLQWIGGREEKARKKKERMKLKKENEAEEGGPIGKKVKEERLQGVFSSTFQNTTSQLVA